MQITVDLTDYFQILQDLLETNIRQRGDVGGSAKKVERRLDELKRLYGIEHGGDRKSKPNNSDLINDKKNQEQLAAMNGMSVDTMENYIMISKMIPELEELLDTGIVTKTTALAIMRSLSEDEQEELIADQNVLLSNNFKVAQRTVS